MSKDKDILYIDSKTLIDAFAEKFDTMEETADALVDMVIKYLQKAGLNLNLKDNPRIRMRIRKAKNMLHKDLVDYVEFQGNGETCPECLHENWEVETYSESRGEFQGFPCHEDVIIGRTCKNCGREETF